MRAEDKSSRQVTRREAIGGSATAIVYTALAGQGKFDTPQPGRHMIVCFIRYQIDPYQLEDFRHYAENWTRIIPRCGGHLLGYFLPHEGTNDIAWGLIGFDSLASYERYRERLRSDPDGRANFLMAQTKRLILREERTFLDYVEGNSPAASPKGE